MMDYKEILNQLPYSTPFLFVDELTFVDENKVEGNYFFSRELDFYSGHFKNKPITPGVILIETMAQIGLVCMGIFLTKDQKLEKIAFTSSEIEFLKSVFPDERVFVVSEKVYFRFGKLKCKVTMYNSNKEIVCSGFIAGMVI